MIIENPEALKSWLTAVLAPLCDADPAALAKYVLALARKDKAESELRTAMCDQLDVFLQQETKGFVDRLFVTLENKSYLQSNPEPPPPSVPGAAAKEELHPSIGVASVNGSSIPPPSSSSTTVAPPYAAAAASAAVPENVARESRTSSSSSNKQKTEQRSSGGGKRRSWSPRSRSRSRDRGQLRQQRSRSPRDRSSRGGGSRNWDDRRSRRSPPVGSSSGGSSQRRSDQRDQRGGGGRRSRSPPRRSSRSPPRRRNQRPSSRSPPPTSSKGENSDKTMTTTTTATDVTGTAPPSVQSVIVAPAGVAAAAGGNKFRCRDYDEKGYCMRGDLCPYDHGNDPVVLEDVELSSMLNYNRPPPGAATAVAAPPPSAVVVVPPPHHHLRGPPPSLSQLPPSVGGEPYNPDAPGISWPPPPMVAGPAGIVPLRPMPPYGVHGGPPYHRGMPPVPVPSHAMRSHPMAHHQHHPHHHNQHRPQMRGGGGGGHPPPMGLLGQAPPSSGGVGRELISVPTAGMGVGGDDVGDLSAALSGGTNKRNVIEAGLDADGHVMKRSHFDYNRLGHQLAPGSAASTLGPDVAGNQQQQQQRRPAFDPTNCCLEVKKIPRGLNNISVLNNHFSKFGKIVNLQVSFGGDPEGALVTFSSHSEAQAAYRSTEAVLNNRFIKVFWHNKEQQQQGENQPPTSAASKSLSVKDRLGGIVGGGQRVLGQSQMGGAPPGATVLDEAAMKEATEAKEKEREKAVAAIKRSQEILAAKEALKKKQEEQKREATKLQVDLQRRKQELLDKQLQQQRVLIERLEKNKSTMKAEERAAVMQTVRTLQETIEKLKRDLQQQPPATAPTTKKSSSSATGGQIQHQAAIAAAAAAVPTAKSVEEARKAVLDTEIELYQKQMEGSDTTELQHRLQELNTLIHQAHRGQPSSRRAIASARMGLRGRGSRGGASARLASRGRGRGGYYSAAPHVSVDRRPTQLKVTGFEGHQQGDILAHFANFGEVVDYQVDEIVPSLTVRYKSRKDAEMALSQGKVNFSDAALHVVWHLPAKTGLLTHQASLKEGDHDLLTSLGVSDELGHGDAALSADENEEEDEDNQDMDDLLNYEEDEDDEVERSWRR